MYSDNYITPLQDTASDIQEESQQSLFPWFSLENIFLFWILLLSVSATTFTSSFDPRVNPLGVAITLALTIAMCVKYSIYYTTTFFVITGTIAGWIALHYFSDTEFKLLAYCVLLFKIFLAYIIVNIFRRRIWHQFHNIVYYLTLIDLFLWIVQNFIGTDFLKSLSFLQSTGTSLGSFLIYSISNNIIYDNQFIFGLIRNAGFCWEPGFYACVLVFAIFANFIIYDNTWRGNHQLYVLILALITTGSTTGYIAFFVMMAVTYIIQILRRPTSANISIMVLSIVLFFSALQLPFMQQKILEQNDSQNFFTEQRYGLSSLEANDQTLTLNRFEGITLDVLNIQDKPWIGYGTLTNSYVYNNISSNIRISNGTTTLFSIYGIPIAIICILLLIWSSIKMRRDITECHSSWFFLLLTVSFSYNFMDFILFIALSLYYILQDNDDSPEEEAKETELEELA